MSLVSKNYVSTILIYQVFKLFWYHCSTVTLLTNLFLCFFLLLDTMTWWWHCHFQVFLLTSSDCSQNAFCAPYFLSLPQLPSTSHSTSACSALWKPSPAIVPCFIVPTHLAHATLGEQRKLFQVPKAFPTMFRCLQSANHFCSSKLLSWLPPCRSLQNEPQQIPLLSCSRNSGNG